MKRYVSIAVAAALVAVAFLALPASADQTVTTPNGTWSVYPGQSASYSVAVQQPINADGSSTFKNSNKAVIPVKFGLSQGLGSFVFESKTGNSTTADDYSYAGFAPASPITFSQLTTLESVYSFATGNCGGGSLRWSVTLDQGGTNQRIFIYYGEAPNFTDCTTSNQSNVNMIGQSDLRYDTSQLGGTFYDSYANAVASYGSLNVVRASLVLDSGWFNGDQVVNLTSATFGTSGYTDVFTPPAPVPSSGTCTLPDATIRVTKTGGADVGPVDEPTTIQPADVNSAFRKVDCKYMYNLATSSLRGSGLYEVEVVIDGSTATGNARFELK